MNPQHTIAAIATPPGRGGVGILRISGLTVRDIAKALLGNLPEPRKAAVRIFRDRDGHAIDHGLALFFPSPHSFTGEDVLEIHAHGGPVVMDMLLARALELGARGAAPGEFSQRAFLNDKLDLLQVEAIADLIDSGSQQAARAALRSLRGEFSARAHELTALLIDARAYIEAALDFPEEEIDFLDDVAVHSRLNRLVELFAATRASATQGALLREGMTVVIAGKPNAGKSRLLNTLAGYEAAIVTAIPGTTRDVLREEIYIDGMPLHIIDTAGLRDTEDLVEMEGIKRAHHEMKKADRVLYVIDSSTSASNPDLLSELARLPAGIPVTLIYNKVDLAEPKDVLKEFPHLLLSARTGVGVDSLHRHLKESMGLQEVSSTTFSARTRHLDALTRAHSRVVNAIELLKTRKAGELMAEHLRLAQQDIGEITGEFTSDDLLGKIFASFCIGK